MKRVLSFKFNANYYLVRDTDGAYYVEREYIGEGSTYFNILENYRPLNMSSRYITHSSRREIEKEIRREMPNTYRQLFDKEPDFEPEPTDRKEEVNMEELLTKLNQQNMEMMKTMMQHNPYEEAIVNAIIEKGKNVTSDSILQDVKSHLDEFIQKEYGTLPQKLTIETKEIKKDMTGIFHHQFETIFKIVERNIPLMLVGPAGSGKNHTLEQIAESLDLEFYFSNAVTQEYKLTGFIDANGTFHETQFYKAFKDGGLFFLDEIDASIPEVLIILNAAIANRYFDFPTGRINAHENFRVVSAANTVGTGADNLYVGRSQLDAATLDRFAVIEFNYDTEVEKQLASSTELYEFIQDLRKVIDEIDLRYVVSMRATINASKLEDIMDKQMIVDSVILKGMEKDERDMIADRLLVTNEYAQCV